MWLKVFTMHQNYLTRKVISLDFFLFFFFLLLLSTSALSQQDSTYLFDEEQRNYLHFSRQGNVITGLDFGIGLGVRNQNINFESATAIVDFNVSPKVGYFITNGVVTGVDFDYFGSVATFNFQNEYRFLLKSYNLYLQYYSPSGFTAEISGGYGNGSEKFVTNGSENIVKFEGYRYGLAVGISNYWSKKLAFSILLRYAGSQGSYKEIEESFFINGLSINAGVTIGLY
ncbi:MAG: hypothetical protein AAGI07_05245 [Bacteroidota bacterium]